MPSIRKHSVTTMMTIAMILAASAPLRAESPAPQAPPAPAAPASLDAASVLSPMMVDINTALADGNARLKALAERADAATGDEESFALQREIEQAKRNIQSKVLGIQAAYARQDGRIEQAERIEAAIIALDKLGAPATPALPAASATPAGRR